ncbi:hypothetical protein GNP94_16100 [Paenibacillus campinasensis]|uniref:Uncharacterized protein n=1 Tax=Paenibacillus campinasensis TaxID=66347 RepID=A0ABW9T509_9BACL|nr:hypothetical protein [Paenibacillus campinasensis]MUG67511.1 hypothetical protein [Paenibacillus campinasensis]
MNRNNLKLAALLPLLLILALGCCLPAFAEALSAQNPKETMPSVRSQQPGGHPHAEGKHGKWFRALADYVKLEPQVLKEKLKTSSLAEIAKQQGIPREQIKEKVMDIMKDRAASHPSTSGKTVDYSAAADRLLDSKGGWHARAYHYGKAMADSNELARLLKMTPEQLRQQLQAGKSLAEIAKAQGVPVQDVIDFQVKSITQRLDQKLKDGKITKEKYDERIAKLNQFVTEFVHGKLMYPKQPPAGHHS